MTVPDLIKVIHLQFQVPVQGGTTFSQITFTNNILHTRNANKCLCRRRRHVEKCEGNEDFLRSENTRP